MGQKKIHSSPIQKNTSWVVILILLITILAFSDSISNSFLTNWDDNTYIINNPQVKDFSVNGIKNIFSSYQIGNYHPLTMLSYTIEYKLFGLNPKVFHFFNLLFHLINVWLVFRLMQLLSKRLEIAVIVAVLFAIHPMHVESVSWIAERKDVLYSMFYLLSLIFYVRYTLSKYSLQLPTSNLQSRASKHYIVSIAFFTLSLLSKSMAVTLPVLLILIDYYLERKFEKKLIIDKLPFFLLSIVFGLIAIQSQSESGAISLAPQYLLFDRFFIAGHAIITYCFKLILPINLSAMYDYPTKINNLLPWEYYLSPFIIVILIWAFIKFSSNKKDVIFGITFFLATISLVIQFIPFGRALIADRYTYIPYIGLFFIIGRLYCRIIDNEIKLTAKIKPHLKNISIALAAILIIMTWQRNKVWTNGYTLFDDVIKKNPNIGYAYFARAEAEDDMKKYPEAIADFTESIRLTPEFMDAYLNRGVIKYYIRDHVGAVADFDKAIELSPTNAAIYMNRAICKLDLNMRKEACDDFHKAASMNFESANKMIKKYCPQ